MHQPPAPRRARYRRAAGSRDDTCTGYGNNGFARRHACPIWFPVPGYTPAQAAYDQAFNLLRSAQYDQAITAFKQFIADHPKGPLSDNAQYWLGEADYVTRQFPAALAEFQKVVTDYPDSPKVPDAELKVGFTHYEMAQWDDARKTLTDVVSKYPDSSAAKLAQNRLQKMKAEGH